MEELLYDVPDILYKYRDWNNPNHKKLLENQELYFASAADFNDPFDSSIPHRFDPRELTDDNIFLKYLSLTNKEHPEWSKEEIHAYSYEFQKRDYLKDPDYIEKFDHELFKEIARDFGIVSLCKNRDTFLLWSHYANCHTGFCIGFDKFSLFNDTQARFEHVIYEDDFPLYSLKNETLVDYSKMMAVKAKFWAYEDEYRLTQIYFSKQLRILRKDTIREIVLGCRMNHKEKLKIIDIAATVYPHAQVFEVSLSKTKFELSINRVF